MSTGAAPLETETAEVDRVLGTRVLRWFSARPRSVDVLVALGCLLVQALVLVLPGVQSLWPSLLLVVLSCAVLLWRRRYPMVVLVALALVSAVGMSWSPPAALLGLSVAVGVYTLASLRSARTALLGYAIAVGLPALGALLLFLLSREASAPSLLDPLALIALTLGIAARGATQRREALAELMNQRLATARVLERQRITAEMHDVVAHSLSTMIALADGASDGWQKHPERSALALSRLGDVGRSALGDMRRILAVLREDDAALDEDLHRLGHNVPDLEELVETLRATGMPVRLMRSGKALSEEPALETTVYRVVQESLTNALRYAVSATRVDVSIDVTDEAVTVIVTDDGRAEGHAPSQGSRRGLPGIAERAVAYGGTSTAGPREDGHGWRTQARLPIDEAGRR